jgi:hypothetical protein
VLAGVLLLFLIKPVFFRRKGDDGGVMTVQAGDEPLLFAFLERLCAAAGAPAPAAVEIDCEANAAARFKRRGLAAGLDKQFVLRIGLPLAGAMTVRQFAGVIAHELGHFRQRGGMAGSYFIRLAIAFFARIVFERDRLDFALLRLRGARSVLGRMIYRVAAMFIEAARGVLWLMLVLGELLSCGVLRRMEYDADLLEAHVAGCRGFTATSRLMLFLAIASRRARYDVADAWNQRRLADDLPALVVSHARQLIERKDEVLKLLDTEKTRWFDTHPCHADRVRNVEALAAEGLLRSDLAARHLFSSFPALCIRATQATYASLLGENLSQAKLIPTRELVEQRLGERRSFGALRRYFRGGMAGSRPVLPAAEALSPVNRDRRHLQQELPRARQDMLALAEAAADAAERFEESNAVGAAARAKVSLAGLFMMSGDAARFRRQAERDQRQHDARRRHAIDELLPFEKFARARFTSALRLALSDPSADVKTQNRTELLVRLCHDVEPRAEDVNRLRDLALQIRILTSAYDDQEPYQPLVNRILDTNDQAIQVLGKLKNYFDTTPYPFAHATEAICLGDVLVPRTPGRQDPVEVHDAAMSAVEAYYDLLYRSLAELAERAEGVEKGLGMEALAEPPEKQDKEAEQRELAEQRRDARKYYMGYGLRAAGGIALVSLLVMLSVSPPTLPALGWPRGDGSSRYAYRPASFRPTPTRVFKPDYYTQRPEPRPTGPYANPHTPRPNRPQPYDPNADRNDSRRGYQPPQPYRPSPQPSRPGPYRPSGPSPGRR